MRHLPAVVLAFAVELLQIVAFTWFWRRQTFMAGTDDLTGLRNRAGLHAALRGFPSPPGVLLLDLSGFKSVNDGFGHDTGDAMLKGVAGRLTEIAPRGAVIGRIGGDEFVVLLPGTTGRDQLIAVADTVRVAVSRARPHPAGDGGGDDRPVPAVSCVIGLALPDALPDPDKPFRAADIALYHARHHGLPYAVYQPGMTHPAAADRHGGRLRDHRPAHPPVVFDIDAFHQHLQPDRTHVRDTDVDALTDLDADGNPWLPEFLTANTPGFGTDVADLLHLCVELDVFRWHGPVTAVVAEPTTSGGYRDGGLRVLVTLHGTLTLASQQWRPNLTVAGHSGPAVSTEAVLDAIAVIACQLATAYDARLTPSSPHRPLRSAAPTSTTGPVPAAATTITAAIADLHTAAAQAGAGNLSPRQTTQALIAAAALLNRLDLRAFEVDNAAGSDDTKELVVITVHGVDLEIRGRRRHGGEELYVHVDDQRAEEQTTSVPLVVEVYPS